MLERLSLSEAPSAFKDSPEIHRVASNISLSLGSIWLATLLEQSVKDIG